MRGILISFSIFLGVLISLNFISTATWTESLNDGLTAYYNFEDTSGRSLINVVDGTNNGTIINGSASVNGIIGNGLNFSSALQQVVLMTQTIQGASGTFSVWYNKSTTNQRLSLGMDEPGRLAGEFSVESLANSIYFWDDGTIGFALNGNNTLEKDTWNNIVVLWGVGGIKLYSDGILVGTDSSTQAPNVGQDWFIGGRKGALPLYSDGVIDEFGIWSRRLNSTEIAELYNNGNGITFNEQPPPAPLENATFNNVNVTNDLTVGNNLDATRGFFDFLGSSISKIIKGWFTELVVEKLNVTGENYLINTTCSSEEVLTTNSDGLVSCTSITEIKSGLVSVTEDSCTSIIFNTNFSSTPVVVGNVENNGPKNNVVSINSPSISGVDICLNKVGRRSTHTVYWTATNAGNS